jgi:hypothetical protein
MKKRFVSDLAECEKLWRAVVRPKTIFDLWEFRMCFHRNFQFDPNFMVMEDSKGVAGLIPLCYVPELDIHAFFPGELWKGRTWIERTPVYTREEHFLPELLFSCPDRTYLRYMELGLEPELEEMEIDEISYGLCPAALDFDMTVYLQRFSGKRLKELVKVIRKLTGDTAAYYTNREDDFDDLTAMNISRFGSDSYLYDPRFRQSFRDLAVFLKRNGWLRMVTLEIDGRKAAIDLGAVCSGGYTVLLGGTNPDFLGAAKVINMHHIEYAFGERMTKIDFLCGDFHWKRMWHLDAEPLYKYVSADLKSEDWHDGQSSGLSLPQFPAFRSVSA